LGAPAPVSVRPFGHPFSRRIRVDRSLEDQLLTGEAHYVIVDEGPGESGSSFGAVADWLQERGVPLERIAFLPSHAGPLGDQASSEHRQRWSKAQRIAADLGDQLPGRLTNWLMPLIGTLDGAPMEISGGEWRRHVFPEQQWPPAQPMWERRKFLADAGGCCFLVKFAGLGSIGEGKLAMARALHAAGHAAEPVGLVHGFLVERWCEDAGSMAIGEKPVAQIARYLGVRARLFPAAAGSGASIRKLAKMVGRNVSLTLGGDAAARLEPSAEELDRLERRVVRVRTDNKLDHHEWRRMPDGRLLKTDALDHHQSHDLIGCQDLAWDVAGAICELDLPSEELIAPTEEAAGRVTDPQLLGFYRIAYPAFRLGQAAMARAAADPSEAARLVRAETRYVAELQHLLRRRRTATRQQSSVG
jgi:hypothetical protein